MILSFITLRNVLMALTPVEQIQEVIKKNRNILITFQTDYSIDSLASSLALFLLLKKLDKSPEVVCYNFRPENNASFLPEIQSIHSRLTDNQKLKISIDVKNNNLDQLSYTLEEGKLNIYITPKTSVIEPNKIKTELLPSKYEVIFVIDTPDLASLGNLYDSHVELFSHTPLVNIDHHPSNEHFGNINFVNIAASSSAEVLYDLIESSFPNLFDSKIATCLLAGIFSKTHCFTTNTLSPKTLSIAGKLIEMDAERNAIVQNLFRNRSIPVINLWGRILARLKYDPEHHIAWSLIPEYDFIDSSTTEEHINGVVEEFISDISDIQIVILFYQKSKDIYIHLHTKDHTDALSLTRIFEPTGTKHLSKFVLKETSILNAEKQVLEAIKKMIAKK